MGKRLKEVRFKRTNYYDIKRNIPQEVRGGIENLWLNDYSVSQIVDIYKISKDVVISYILGYAKSNMLKQVNAHLSALEKEISERADKKVDCEPEAQEEPEVQEAEWEEV